MILDATGKQTARKSGNATYFSEDLGNGITLDMVKIPGSMFRMGATKTIFLDSEEEGSSDNEFPQHSVTVKEFCMGKFAITQAQWKSIAILPKVNIDLDLDPSNFKGENLPVEEV